MDEPVVAVEVENLTKRYPGQSDSNCAVKNVSFKIHMGQVVCLLGPNGSGKTTLLKILTGLLRPTSGTVKIMGKDIIASSLEVRSHIGWMPAEERSGLYGRLTGWQNLEFFSSLQGVVDKEFHRIVGNLALQIDIKEELEQTILKNSGGNRQKIALIRALVHNPAVIFLDEPMRNLDPHTVRRFRRLLRDHLTRIQKKTVFLSTHQLDEARRLADWILIMKNGEIIRTLDHREIEKELKNKTVEELYIKTIDGDEN